MKPSNNNPGLDRFQRFPFAKTIADAILTRHDSSTIVIGINGSWGEGKTTVLDFIDGILSKVDKHTVVRFNPWRYGEEEVLLTQFFETIANAIRPRKKKRWWHFSFLERRPLQTKSEYFFDKVSKSSKGIDFVKSGLGDVVSDIGKKFATVELESLKARLNASLKESGQKITIIIDDIDRLEDREVHAIFRLVKLTADFHNTTYILSFDESVIAKVVGQRHTSNESGGSFLEKIIQVPLKLPPAQTSDLHSYCIEGINRILDDKGITVNDVDTKVFSERFFTSILPLLKTPRMAIRYWNSINYSLDMLKGEVNIADLLTIEALKIFRFPVYEFIRTRPELFIEHYRYEGQERIDKINQAKDSLKTLLQEGPNNSVSPLKDLLIDLFPLLKEAYQNVSHPPSFIGQLIAEKRIASQYYFDRYFALVVLKNQISDLELDVFMAEVSTESEGHFQQWSNFVTRNADELITKVMNKRESFTYDQTVHIIRMIKKSSSHFSMRGRLGFFGSDASRAAILTIQLVRRFESKAEILIVLNEFVEEADLDFTFEFLRFVYPGTEKTNNFPPREFVDDLTRRWVGRYLKLSGNDPLFKKFPVKAYSVLTTWATVQDKAVIEAYLNKTFDVSPTHILDFLLAFTPYYTTSTGISGYGNLEKEYYDKIGKVIEQELLYRLILRNYPEDSKIPASYSDTRINPSQSGINVLRQFLELHIKNHADV